MNNICKKCAHNDLTDCTLVAGTTCKLFQNKLRIQELNLSKQYLNSNYYWKRLRELNGEDNSSI
jgi:hypothetical protein